MESKRAIYTFSYLFQAVKDLADEEQLQTAPLVKKVALVSMLAFAYEAFANHCGEQVIKCWGADIKPKMSPLGKLNLLYEIAGDKINSGSAPFQTCKKVLDIRNNLAHGKTEYVAVDEQTVSCEHQASWEKSLSHIDLNQAITDFEEITQELPEKLNIRHVPARLLLQETM